MCRVTFRCVKAWSFCELHQCVTTGAGDGVVHQQRLQLPMGKRCAFGRNVKLMRLACHKKEKWWEMSAVTPAKTRNDKEHTQYRKRGYRLWNHLVQIFGIFWITCNIGSTSCYSGKSGHKTCEQEQEDFDRAIRWLRKRGQVVESVKSKLQRFVSRKENSRVNLCHCYSLFMGLSNWQKNIPKFPSVQTSGIDRAFVPAVSGLWLRSREEVHALWYKSLLRSTCRAHCGNSTSRKPIDKRW